MQTKNKDHLVTSLLIRLADVSKNMTQYHVIDFENVKSIGMTKIFILSVLRNRKMIKCLFCFLKANITVCYADSDCTTYVMYQIVSNKEILEI